MTAVTRAHDDQIRGRCQAHQVFRWNHRIVLCEQHGRRHCDRCDRVQYRAPHGPRHCRRREGGSLSDRRYQAVAPRCGASWNRQWVYEACGPLISDRTLIVYVAGARNEFT